ncbi:MAG: LuxR C-terminal-related transcriptional regulator [Acidimicrobiales bacterium]
MTKLRPPRLSERVVERPRITRMLDDAIESSKALALVSAPAGAGKSTALATWLTEQEELAAAWLQVDQRDNDPIRFWAGVIAALTEIQPGIDDRLLSELRAPNVAFVDGALPVLVNTLNSAGPLVIMLDDYHLVASPEVHHGVQALVDALPESVTLMISCRVDPPLRLGKLRVRDQLAEIRAHDLSFSPDEASSFFPGEVLADAEIEMLCTRTEGWAAGLALAASSLARCPDPTSFVADFAGDNRLVVDYLVAELWDGLSDEIRQTMMATSILDQMCGSLVDAVVGTDHGAEWLELAAGENQLMLALDEQRHWYRYHGLLRDLLRNELNRTRPDEVVHLHRRATEWFIAAGQREDAIRHAFAATDLETAAGLVAAAGDKVIQDGHLRTLQGWLDQLGPDMLDQHVGCAVLQVWVHVIDGRFDRAGRWLDTVRAIRAGDRPSDHTASIGELAAGAAVLTALGQGDVGAAIAAAEELIASAAPAGLSAIASDIIGDCQVWAGRYDEARPLLEQAAHRAIDHGLALTACTSRRDLAILALEDGDPGLAQHYAQQALTLAEANHLAAYHQLALAHSVLGVASAGEAGDANRRHLDAGVELARRSNRPMMLAYALAARAQHNIEDQRTEVARIDLTEARRVLDRCPDPGMVLTLVARGEARVGGTGSPRPKPVTNMVEELTPRELTILRLLPSRLNVSEIALELYVSPNTVRGHVKAIYRKLGVNERAVAVQRARELRLL